LHVATVRFESPLLRLNRSEGLVCPMTTALTPTELRGAGRIIISAALVLQNTIKD